MSYPRILDDGSIWIAIMPPVIWAIHFLTAYWSAAVWCARTSGGLELVTWAVVGLTVLALAAIGWIARIAVVDYEGDLRPRSSISGDENSQRKRFLGHVALLLCTVNAVAVLFTSVPALVFWRC